MLLMQVVFIHITSPLWSQAVLGSCVAAPHGACTETGWNTLGPTGNSTLETVGIREFRAEREESCSLLFGNGWWGMCKGWAQEQSSYLRLYRGNRKWNGIPKIIPTLEKKRKEDAAGKGALCSSKKRRKQLYCVFWETWNMGPNRCSFIKLIQHKAEPPAHPSLWAKTLLTAWKHSDCPLQLTALRSRHHTPIDMNTDVTELQVTRFHTTAAFCLEKSHFCKLKVYCVPRSAGCRHRPLWCGGCTAAAEICSALLPGLPSRRNGGCKVEKP